LLMEVRDPIHGPISVSGAEIKTIDSPFFQRLRNIKQMGFSEYGFPGATHTRYLHSIGTMYLAGQAFDSIFSENPFLRPELGRVFRQLTRVAALLHDIGHAPLSHCTEFAMPRVRALNIPSYAMLKHVQRRRATHEDYTVKIISDSSLTRVLEQVFPDFRPVHIAALVDNTLPIHDDFFMDGGVNYRPVLAQVISSELDVDRMDYLRRDSYFAGVSYGNYDCNWIISHLTFHVSEQDCAHLALDPKAIYAFNDFLLSRYHMFLMVYLHHKSVIYEEMLKRYFQGEGATYAIPAEIEDYVLVDDYQLFNHLRREAKLEVPWTQRLVDRKPFRLLHELHGGPEEIDLAPLISRLEAAGIPYIASFSTGNLSKYTTVGQKRRQGPPIYVLGSRSALLGAPVEAKRLEECTDLFLKYETERQISRLYVPPEQLRRAQKAVQADVPRVRGGLD